MKINVETRNIKKNICIKIVGYEFTMREGDGLRQCSYFVVCITLLNNENKLKIIE